MAPKYAWRTESGAAWVGTLDDAQRSGCEYWECWSREKFWQEESELRTAVEKVRGIHGHRGVGGAKVHLSERERKSLENYIGLPVEDAQDARRKMRRRGVRFVEKGEEVDERFDAHVAAANGENVGDRLDLSRLDLWGDEARRKPFGKRELRDTYLANCQKYGTKPRFEIGD